MFQKAYEKGRGLIAVSALLCVGMAGRWASLGGVGMSCAVCLVFVTLDGVGWWGAGATGTIVRACWQSLDIGARDAKESLQEAEPASEII